MILQILHDLQRIFHMPLHSYRQGFQSLQEQECGERRYGCAGIPQQDRPDVGHKGCRSGCFRKGNTVVTRVRLGDPGILSGCLPVKCSAVYDHAADCGAVSVNKLGG